MRILIILPVRGFTQINEEVMITLMNQLFHSVTACGQYRYQRLKQAVDLSKKYYHANVQIITNYFLQVTGHHMIEKERK